MNRIINIKKEIEDLRNKNTHKWEVIGFSQKRGTIKKCSVCGLINPPFAGQWSEEILCSCEGGKENV